MAEGAHLSRRVLADEVREHLLQGILNGEFPPSSRIVETSLARDLGVSQAPVREALRALEAVGLVRIEPHRGARVYLPSPREIVDSNLVRESLESLAINSSAGSLASADLRAAHDEMLERAAAGDARGFTEADVAFHAALVALPNNSTLSRVWHSLQPLSRTYMTAFIADLRLDWLVGLHTPILTALEAGSGEEANRALQTHFAALNRRIAATEFKGSED